MTSISLAPVFDIARVLLMTLVPISLVLLAQQRILIPLYGSYPALYHLNTVAFIAISASALSPFRARKSWNWLAASFLLTVAPNASYWVAVWTARKGWILLGPALVHAAVVAPLLFVFTSILVQSGTVNPAPHYRLLKAGATYFITKFLTQEIWPRAAILRNVSESQIFLALATLAFSTFILSLDFSPGSAKSKRGKKLTPKVSYSPTQIRTTLLVAFTILWSIISPQFTNPILPHPLREIFTHPTGRLQIRSAVQSVTGLIEVGETLPSPRGEEDSMRSVRYLRADHSLLGGVWTKDRAVALDNEPLIEDSYGAKLGDTVYSTFALQEVARLVDSTETGRTGEWKNALTIGLGTGFSTTAFIRHGLNTTVVEIDPAVYDAARRWFGLPDPGPWNVFLEDARQFVERRSREIQISPEENLYDIVVHDCFSGGGVPAHIFTTEFWNYLKQIMNTEGILVVNFAGIPISDSSKMILHTLEYNFKQCRAFHDWMNKFDEDKYDQEFINIVFFCTNSELPLTFRKPKRSDLLGSHLRKFIFKDLDSREVNLALLRESDTEQAERYVLRDKHNPLGDLQRKQGFHHWKIMRKVLKDVHWETY